MRKFVIVLSILLFTTFGFSQTFNLEHHFMEGNAQQIDLDISGNKYMVLDRTNNAVNFYNPDYTFWKSVALSVPIGYSILEVPHVSEAKINPDANLEIAYTYTSDFAEAQRPYSQIIAENGAILLANDFVQYRFSEIEDVDAKMYYHNFAEGTTTIYKLAGLVLDGIKSTILAPVHLESSGGKFYSYNIISETIEILNPDSSLWRSIPISSPIENIQFISETGINPDPLIEIGYIDGTDFKLINEEDTPLLTVANATSAKIDKIATLDNKLFVSTNTSILDGSPVRIYSLPSFAFESEYIGRKVERVNLEVSGEKYAVSNYGSVNEGLNTVELYNTDHSLWKSIALPTNPTYDVIAIGAITQTIFASDDQVELIYSTQEQLLLDSTILESYIINESGQIIFSQELSSELVLDFSNAAPRLISQIIYGSFGINTFEAQIFTLDNTMGIADQAFHKTMIYPNPSLGTFQIQDSHRRITSLEIMNVNGQIIDRITGAEIFFYDNLKLSPGLYLVKLTDHQLQQSTHKIVVGL